MAFNPKSPEGHTAWDYAQTIITQLHQLIQSTEQGRGDEPQIRRLAFNMVLDGNGAGRVEYEIPQGKNWTLTGIGFSATLNNGDLGVYVNEVNGNGLIKVLSVVSFSTDTFDNADVSPDDRKLIVDVSNGISGVQIQGNIRLRQYDANPNPPREATG